MSEPTLSLFHKILIFVEDKEEALLSDIATFGPKRQTLGALGRLEGLGYVKRIKKSKEDIIILTDLGDQVIAEIIEYMPEPNHTWDGKWRMILFDVPESKRTVRQMFRLKLLYLGARMFQSSVWITPNPLLIERFRTIVEDHGYNENVHFFEATCIAPESIDVTTLWKLKDLKKEYDVLFSSFRQQLKQVEKENNPSYHAKCMIMSLALMTKKDPQLPEELTPKPWITQEIFDWHNKLRNYL